MPSTSHTSEKTENLKNKLDGNHLDLSLSSLEVVPVKELTLLPKATSIDISCNLLTSLPVEFCQLLHLVRIDLSKNHLTSLPPNFGNLQKLQHLDLYHNKLETLPVSFSQLKNLKWLDIKDNPLNESLSLEAGACIDDSQCKICAKKVVSFMQKIQSEQERQKQKKLQEERENTAARKREEEEERKQKQIEKKAEREVRKREFEKRKNHDNNRLDAKQIDDHVRAPTPVHESLHVSKKQKWELSPSGVLLLLFIMASAFVAAIYIYCSYNPTDKNCITLTSYVERYAKVVLHSLNRLLLYVKEQYESRFT